MRNYFNPPKVDFQKLPIVVPLERNLIKQAPMQLEHSICHYFNRCSVSNLAFFKRSVSANSIGTPISDCDKAPRTVGQLSPLYEVW